VSTESTRLSNYNLIAAISTKNRSAFVVANGSNNQLTFLHFLLQLCSMLQLQDPNWRNNVVFLLDNAAYHRGKECMDLFKRLKLPVLF